MQDLTGHEQDYAPLISVVIATYNMGRFLPEAVASALQQTYSKVELRIVDDGSTDDTKDIIAPFLSDGRVHYHFQQNSGQASAKNLGVRESRGDLVAFLDADDVWMPSKLTRQYRFFADRPSLGVAYAKLLYIDEAGRDLGPVLEPMHRGRITEPLFVRNFIGFPTTVVRRECFEALGGFDEDLAMGIDWQLWLRFSTRYEFDFVPAPLAYYRVWSGQMSRNYRGRYEHAMRIMRSFLESHPHAVSPRTVRHAWADTYVNRGCATATQEGDVHGALSDFLKALSYDLTFWRAWKAILKLGAGRL